MDWWVSLRSGGKQAAGRQLAELGGREEDLPFCPSRVWSLGLEGHLCDACAFCPDERSCFQTGVPEQAPRVTAALSPVTSLTFGASFARKPLGSLSAESSGASTLAS